MAAPTLPPWLSQLVRSLRFGRSKRIVVLRAAGPEHLGLVAHAVGQPTPYLCRGLAQLADVPHGATVVFSLPERELAAANFARPVFSERALHAVWLMSDAEYLTARDRAPDLLDWASATIAAEPVVPAFVREGLQLLGARFPGVSWRGPVAELARALGAAPLEAPSPRAYSELVVLLRGAEDAVWVPVADEAQALRLRAAVAEAQPSVRVFTDGEVPGWPTLDPRVASWAELEAVPLKVAAAVECEWAALFHSTGGDDLRALAGDAPLPQVRDALARHDAPAQLRLLEGPALAALQAQDVGQLALVAAWADRCVAVPRFESSAHRLAAATLPALIRLDDRASLTSIAHVMGWLDLAARWRPADLEGELRRLNHAGAVQVAALLANEEPGSQAGVEEVLQAAFALAESGATEEADRRLAALLDRPGLSPPNRAAALRSLAHQRLQAGKPQEAVDFAREALTIQRETLGQAHPEVGSTAHYLGRALREAGQAAEAEPVLREALRVKAEGAGDASATYAATLHELGSTLGALGYLQEAEVALCDALATKRSTLPAHHPEIARTLHELGVVVLRSGRPDEAASLFSDAIALQPKGSVGWAVSAAMRAQLVARDDPAKGVAQLHEALNTHVERRGAAHPVSRAMADNLASLLGETPPRP